MVGIAIALVAGLAAGLIAGNFKTAMALLKPAIDFVSHAANHLGRVMALFWFGFGNPWRAIYHYRISRPLTLPALLWAWQKCKQTT